MNPGNTNIERTEVSMETAANALADDPPFHILVLGDFSSGKVTNKQLIPKELDRDNFNAVLAQTCPRIVVENEAKHGIEIEIRELDDFHPDNLFSSLPIFEELRNMRSMLLNESKFTDAANQVRSWFEPDIDERPTAETPPVELEEGGDLLEDILGSRNRDAAAYAPKNTSLLKDFVKEVVDPHLVKVDEDEQAKLVGAVDEVTSGLMRKILHDKEFRRLESAWRGLFLMSRRIETSSELKIFIGDISKDRFSEEIKSEAALSSLLAGGAASNGDEPWAVVAAAFDFDINVDDIACLMRAGGTTGTLSTPFVSHIRPGMFGFRSFAENSNPADWVLDSESVEAKLWEALRNSEDADSIGLIVPRLLSRLPYGASTEPLETFEFEEVSGTHGHDDYVWMNPVFGFTVLIAASFSRYGWEIERRYELDLDGLPVHVTTGVDGSKTKPCAEIEMTDAGLGTLLKNGLMPFASYKDTDRVRLGGIQSVGDSGIPLKARWK